MPARLKTIPILPPGATIQRKNYEDIKDSVDEISTNKISEVTCADGSINCKRIADSVILSLAIKSDTSPATPANPSTPGGGSGPAEGDTQACTAASGQRIERHFKNGVWGPWHLTSEKDATLPGMDNPWSYSTFDPVNTGSLEWCYTICDGNFGLPNYITSGKNGMYAAGSMSWDGSQWIASGLSVINSGVALYRSGGIWHVSVTIASGHSRTFGPLENWQLSLGDDGYPSGAISGDVCSTHPPEADHSGHFLIYCIFGKGASALGGKIMS